MVAAEITSSGRMRICVHANESTSGMLVVGDVPGL
jgi:hypothetical protein